MRHGVAVVITDAADRFLVQRRNGRSPRYEGLVGFPGGKIEPGEDAISCAVREFGEETGARLFRSTCRAVAVHASDDGWLTAFVRGEWRGRIRDAEGRGDWAWMTVEELDEEPLIPGVRAFLFERHLLLRL